MAIRGVSCTEDIGGYYLVQTANCRKYIRNSDESTTFRCTAFGHTAIWLSDKIKGEAIYKEKPLIGEKVYLSGVIKNNKRKVRTKVKDEETNQSHIEEVNTYGTYEVIINNIVFIPKEYRIRKEVLDTVTRVFKSQGIPGDINKVIELVNKEIEDRKYKK